VRSAALRRDAFSLLNDISMGFRSGDHSYAEPERSYAVLDPGRRWNSRY
jgi:hypothetical protein